MTGEHSLEEFFRRILLLPQQASTVAADIDHLHYAVIITTMLGAAAVTVTGIVFVSKYRARSETFAREDTSIQPPLWIEWVVVAGLLGLFCLFWLVGFWQFVRVQTPPEDSLDVYVTGKQWMWKFAYPDGRNSISTLYVPVSRPVRLLLTSRDVIHSFYVPAFRVKQDAIPGRYTTMWFTATEPGRYWIFCTEFCGLDHSLMRGEVVALLPEDYARWEGGAQLAAEGPDEAGLIGFPNIAGDHTLNLEGPEQTPPLGGRTPGVSEDLNLVHLGERIAAQEGCLRCHTLDGTAYIGPTWAGLYMSKIPLEAGGVVVADPAYLTESMMDPAVKIHEGFPGVMPSYQGLLTPAEIAAILELMKALRDVPLRPEAAALAAPAQVEDEPLPLEPPAIQQGLPPPGTEPSPAPTGDIQFPPQQESAP